MPLDFGIAGAEGTDPDRPGVYVPGFWEFIRGRYLREIKRGDARGLGLSPLQRRRTDAQPHSTVSAARRELEKMTDGQAQISWPPSRQDFPCVAAVDWLNGAGRCRRVRVWPNDYVEDADE